MSRYTNKNFDSIKVGARVRVRYTFNELNNEHLRVRFDSLQRNCNNALKILIKLV